MVCGDEKIAKDEGGGIGIGEGDGKLEWLGDRVVVEIQRVTDLVERIREIQSEVATLEGKVAGEEGQEDKVAVEVREKELMMCGE